MHDGMTSPRVSVGITDASTIWLNKLKDQESLPKKIMSLNCEDVNLFYRETHSPFCSTVIFEWVVSSENASYCQNMHCNGRFSRPRESIFFQFLDNLLCCSYIDDGIQWKNIIKKTLKQFSNMCFVQIWQSCFDMYLCIIADQLLVGSPSWH